VAIIVLLAAIAAAIAKKSHDSKTLADDVARKDKAHVDCGVLAEAAKMYRLKYGDYPPTLAQLTQRGASAVSEWACPVLFRPGLKPLEAPGHALGRRRHGFRLGWDTCGGISVRHGVPPKQTQELFGDELRILRLCPPNAIQSKSILRHRQVADLPGDMGNTSCWLAKPVLSLCVIQEPDGVVAGEHDLLDGQL
jgi:hypothetical protein